MFADLGRTLGITIIVFYLLAVLNYIVKFINRRYRNVLKKGGNVPKGFTKFMRFIVKNHRVFGLATVLALLSHFYVQFNRYGFSSTGAMAASLLILQVGLGIYGSRKKQRNGIWLFIHRTIAVLLLIAILNHVI